ncbi:MAG: PfkB family carbohydrate kinase, partial [Planctomycetota bacterium]
IHLRAPSELADEESLTRLATDLQNIVDENSICVFAGALPEGALLADCVCLIGQVRDSGAKIAVDTSGIALKQVLESGHVWLIKPNLEELRQLLGRDVEDNESSIVEAARQVCEKVELVVVSRRPLAAGKSGQKLILSALSVVEIICWLVCFRD